MEQSLLYYKGIVPSGFQQADLVENPVEEEKEVNFNVSREKQTVNYTFDVKKIKTVSTDDMRAQASFGGGWAGGGFGRSRRMRMKRRKMRRMKMRRMKGRGKGGVDDEEEDENKEPRDFEHFKEILKQKEKDKRTRYYKNRGRPKGGKKEDAGPVFVLTEEIKLAMGEVKDELYGRLGPDYPSERGAMYCSRQAFRAIFQQNYELLQKVMNDLKAHNPLMPRSADEPRNILTFAIERDDKVAVELILKFLEEEEKSGGGQHDNGFGWGGGWGQQKRKFVPAKEGERVRIKSNLEKIQTGRLSRYAIGRHVKKVNISRGNREGNNAFTDDMGCYSNNFGSNMLQQSVQVCIQTGKISSEMFAFISTHRIMKNQGGNLDYSILRSFNSDMIGEVLKRHQSDKGHGVSKLHVAAISNTEEEGLGKYRSNQVTKKTMYYQTNAVHFSALNKHTDAHLGELIAENPLVVKIGDQMGRKPIHYAAANEKVHALECLVGYGSDAGDVGDNMQTPLMIAAETNRPENIKFILEVAPESANIQDNVGNTALHIACRNGHFGAVRALLEVEGRLVDPNIKNNEKQTAIVLAVKLGFIEIVKLLKQKEAEVKVFDKHGKCLLMEAIKNLHFDLARWLIEEGGLDPTRSDTSGNSIVHYATGYDNLDGLKLLISCGCNTNVSNQWKNNPLQIAMLKSNWYIFDYLLKVSGIDVNAKDEEGKTMIFLLLEKKDESFADQIMHLVTEKGADVSIRSVEGTSLFHLLAENPHDDDLKLAEFLFEQKAEIDLKNKNEDTPLMLSCVKKNYPLFKFLLKNGAEIEEREEGEENILHRIFSVFKFEQKLVKIEDLPQTSSKRKKKDEFGSSDEEEELEGEDEDEDEDQFGFGGWGGFGGKPPFKPEEEELDSSDPKKKKIWVIETKYYDDLFTHLSESKKKTTDDDSTFRKLSLGVDERGRTPLMKFMDDHYSCAVKEHLPLLSELIEKTLRYSQTSIEDHAIVKIEKKEKKEDEEDQTMNDPYGMGMGYGGARRHHYGMYGHQQQEKQPKGPQEEKEIGRTMLHFSVLKKNEKLIDILISKFKADVNYSDLKRKTPVLLSIRMASSDYSCFRNIGKKFIEKYSGDLLHLDASKRGVLHYVFIKQQQQKQQQQTQHGFGWGRAPRKQKSGRKGKSDQQGREPMELLSDLCIYEIPMDEPDVYGRTPLHYASIRGFTICSMFLIDKKADVNRPDEDENTCLSLGLMSKHVDYSICLINKGANIKSNMLELKDVNMTFKKEIELKKKQALEDQKDGNKLGKGGRMKKRVRKRRSAAKQPSAIKPQQVVDEKKEKISIFKYIIKEGFMGMFFLALSQGISFFQGIQDAITLQKWSLVLKILEKTKKSVICSSNENGENMFHYIARAKVPKSKTDEFLKIANTLVTKYEVDPNLKSKDKNLTPFIYACYARNKTMMEFFLKHCQSNVNDSDPTNSNITPLIYFIQKNDLELVEYLLKHKDINVNHKDENGKTAIFYVAQPTPYGSFQNVKLFKTLLLKGVDMNIKDSNGLDILYYIFLQREPILRNFILKSSKEDDEHMKPEKQAELIQQTSKVMNLVLQSDITDFRKYFDDDNVTWNIDEDFEKVKSSLIEKEKESTIIKDPRKLYHSVNPVAKLPEGCLVHQEVGENTTRPNKIQFYNVVLTRCEIKYGIYGYNMFYKLQLVHNPMQDLYVLINHYGRVGQKGVYQMTPFDVLENGKKEFKKIFRSKTKNVWDEFVVKGNFEKHHKKYKLVDHHLRHGLQKRLYKPLDLGKFPASKLPSEVQDLISLVGDTKIMSKMLESSLIDTNIFSLANLTKERLQEGYRLLCELEKAANSMTVHESRYYSSRSEHGKEMLRSKQETLEKINDLSSQYYSLLPSSQFRSSLITPIQEVDTIKSYKKRLTRLIDMENTLKTFVASRNQKKVSPLDYVYQSLGCDITPLETDSVAYKMIMEMITFTSKGFIKKDDNKIMNIFKVKCASDWDRFEKRHLSEKESQTQKGKKLFLFHGTKVTNLLSILKDGLKIEPKFASRTGRLFGDGCYFSDSFDKSLGYTLNFGNFGVMLVCECDVGVPFCTFKPKNIAVQKITNDIDSVKGIGWNGVPKEKMLIHTYEGVHVPNGLKKMKANKLREEVQESRNHYEDVLIRSEKEMQEMIKLSEEEESKKDEEEQEGEDDDDEQKKEDKDKDLPKEWFRISVYNQRKGGWSSNGKGIERRSMKLAVSPNCNVYVLKKVLTKRKDVEISFEAMTIQYMGRKLENHEIISELEGIKDIILFMNQDWNIARKKSKRKKGRKVSARFMMRKAARKSGGVVDDDDDEEEEPEEEPVLGYNEYILYEEKKFRIRYIIQFEF